MRGRSHSLPQIICYLLTLRHCILPFLRNLFLGSVSFFSFFSSIEGRPGEPMCGNVSLARLASASPVDTLVTNTGGPVRSLRRPSII